jgi:hypothetical protein
MKSLRFDIQENFCGRINSSISLRSSSDPNIVGKTFDRYKYKYEFINFIEYKVNIDFHFPDSKILAITEHPSIISKNLTLQGNSFFSNKNKIMFLRFKYLIPPNDMFLYNQKFYFNLSRHSIYQKDEEIVVGFFIDKNEFFVE